MAVQTLAKDQAIKEKKKQKKLDEKFKKDDENAEKDAERMMDLMDKIYNKPKFGAPPRDMKDLPLGLSPQDRLRFGPGGPVLEAKKGGLMKKCGIQLKGTSPLLKKRKGKK